MLSAASASPLFVAVLVAIVGRALAASGRGCVDLDELTFDRVLRRFPAGALVKFDIAYPYGDKHDAYEKLALDAAAAASNDSDLLVAAVGIKDYGEKDNRQLAERFGVQTDRYPDVQLFVGGASGRRFRFPADSAFTADNLKQFVRRNSGIAIGLAGCVPELDALAAQLVEQLALGERDAVTETLRRARQWSRDASQADAQGRSAAAGPVYVRLMELTVERGLPFVAQEKQRVRQLLNGKISAAKRRDLEHRINVLTAFVSEDAKDAVHEAADVFGDEL